MGGPVGRPPGCPHPHPYPPHACYDRAGGLVQQEKRHPGLETIAPH